LKLIEAHQPSNHGPLLSERFAGGLPVIGGNSYRIRRQRTSLALRASYRH